MIKNKRIAFVMPIASRLQEPTAPNARYLAIARGLSEQGIVTILFLLNPSTDSSLLDIRHHPNVRIVNGFRIKHKGYGKKSIKQLISIYTSLFSLGRYLANLGKCFDKCACYIDGHKLFQTLLKVIICSMHHCGLFYFRAEYPLLACSNNSQRLLHSMFWKYCIVPKLDHIFVISHALKQYYEEVTREVPISMLNMMVETDRFRASDNLTDVQYKDIVYVGTMYGDKDGVYNLIKAFGLIMDTIPEARLVLVGDNKRRELMTKIDEALSSLSDISRVIFSGVLDRDGVIQRINHAYCLALARPDNVQAKYGFPTKLGEYLSTGRPVVVTAVGDIPLFLRDGYNAYVSKPDDTNAFALKLETCLTDGKVAQDIGAEGRKLAETVFCYKQAVQPVLEVLRNL